MPTPHSSVNYIEPNFSSVKGEFSGKTFLNWALDDDYERAPRLEDYSIMLNIEVEICSRKNISKSETITKDVLILQYSSREDGKSAVNFMGGTKVQCNDTENHYINSLTTNYADMYVGDLISYGTTEMIGIKSVDIEYQKSCVPIISIKFTDVRGLSLFQPTELSRTNAYQGIGGISANNVAQSFFQCFFRVPMPKFTITIKGFYGKPVTYEVLCDKFETSFNSETGDFDIDTRFIGYNYSFLTDIVMDALLAAPYSDYGGMEGGFNKHWTQQIESGRFTIPNKDKTSMDRMPTLYEILSTVKIALKNSSGASYVVSEEEKNHSNEIEELTELVNLYSLWYSTLYNICVEKYGKDYVFLFKDMGCEYRLLILTYRPREELLTKELLDLAYTYESFPDNFKEINRNLSSAINEYNSKDYAFQKIKNVSIDFSSYRRTHLFNRLFINTRNEIVFNGFDKKNTLPHTDVFNALFNQVDGVALEYDEDIDKHKKHILDTIYNDGVTQYIDCFSIDVDYRPIKKRIEALKVDASRNPQEKMDERRRKEFNKEMFKKLRWYPSVENFSRIMMAHLETLMKQLYDCINACEGRKASELGVNPRENLDVQSDSNDPEIPPFPRVFRTVMGDDGLPKNEDTWVGEFTNGKGFEETNFINGIFNGAEHLMALYQDTKIAVGEQERESNMESASSIIKHPLTSLDFYINKSPYGSSSDLFSDTNGYALAGKIAIRMYSILALNHFRSEFGNGFFGFKNPELIGRIEADNFYESTRITNDRVITMIRNDVFSEDNIISYITSGSTDMPWGKKPLFTNKNSSLDFTRYRVFNEHLFMNGSHGYYNYIYPIQNISYSKADEALRVLNQGMITNLDGDIALSGNIPDSIDDAKANITDNYGYGTTLILDDISKIDNQLMDSNSSSDSGYTEICNMISSAASFDSASEFYGQFAVVNGPHSISNRIVFSDLSEIQPSVVLKPDYAEIDGYNPKIHFSASNTVPDGQAANFAGGAGVGEHSNTLIENGFSMQSSEGNFSDIVITEIFGFKMYGNDENSYMIDENGSLVSNSVVRTTWSIIDAGSHSLSSDEVKMTFVLMGILLNTDAIGEYLSKPKTVVYLPKLAVLQIGAIIYASGGIHPKFYPSDFSLRMAARRHIPVGGNSYSSKLFKYIATLSTAAKHQYEKYYIDWLSANSKNASKFCIRSSSCYLKTVDSNGEASRRAVLNQDDESVKELTNELLKAVCVVKLTFNHHRKADRVTIEEGVAKSYLKGFVNRLKEHYGINTEESGSVIKTTKEPSTTTLDMKKELYRYMKQVYDKWIPMSSLKNWELESFFVKKNDWNDAAGSEDIGHKFYFIDSYYNDISQKLLINPVTIANKVEALLSSTDINSMLLGFIGDMYSANKAMLMTIQNFADLRKKGSMNEMFTPMPYNSINWPINKYSSFVVVYPYQASKNLNIPNGEFKDDGFMLNDEFETPIAIRGKEGEEKGHYNIPAFGVSYGKQYQSYFKKVNIDMKSPVATEQSIRAKEAILFASPNKGEGGTVSQDLYDVYASQSYTCSVEMMGCAWVQPLMYFVLLNVPMFRGSYMIMKVKHSIRPGNMTTTFTGCRMANVSNTLVEDIFTEGDFTNGNTNITEYENEKQRLADIDKDCPYKIFPLGGGGGIDLSSELDRKVQLSDCQRQSDYNYLKNDTILTALSKIAANEGGQVEKLELQTMLITTTMYNRRIKSGDYKWIFWHGQYDLIKAKEANPKSWVIDIVRNIFTQSPSWILTKYNKTTVTNGNLKARVTSKKFREGQRIGSTVFTLDDLRKIRYFDGYGEYADGSNEDVVKLPVVMAEDASEGGANGHCFHADMDEPFMWETITKPSTNDVNNKKDVNQAFFDAINASAQVTPSISVSLNKEEVQSDGKTYLRIFQEANSNKLGNVFDMILNSKEYYKYVVELGCMYPNGGLEVDSSPNSIYCLLSENTESNNKQVWFTLEGQNIGSIIPKYLTDGNTILLKSLAKHAKSISADSFKKEIPQINDESILEKYKPKDCNSLFSTNGGNPSGLGDNSSWAKAVQSMGKWYEANIHTYQHSQPPNKGTRKRKYYDCPLINGKVGDDCSGYVSACLQYFGVLKKGLEFASIEYTNSSNVADLLKSGGFTKLKYSWDIVQPYDIISGPGHVEILAEKGDKKAKSWGWGSVHDGRTYDGKTRDIMPAKTDNRPWTNWYETIFRYTS